MEQDSRRKQFLSEFFVVILGKLDDYVTQRILDYLYEDSDNPFRDLNPVLRDLPDMNTKKCFLLMKFTEHRDSTIYLANVMMRFSEPNIAEYLLKYNKSAEFIPYCYDSRLQVYPAEVLRGGDSMCFNLKTDPKGFCLIILNEPELEREAIQVLNVFRQIGFNVSQLHKDISAIQIERLFEDVATNQEYVNYNCLVTIMIGHGQSGSFIGADFENNPEDKISIPKLIDKFAGDNKDRNFNNQSGKPKIHIFNCCRDRSESGTKKVEGELSLLEQMKKFNPNWVNNNINTTVIYSCSEGQEAFYLPVEGFSFFGRALTHVLAQYACEQELNQLLRTLNKRLEFDGLGNHQFPEVIHYRARWQIYFNPGKFETNKEVPKDRKRLKEV